MKVLIAAHNRPESLKRLLQSLQGDAAVWVSIDGENAEVAAVANDFAVERIIRNPHQGLKKHLFACIQLAETEGPLAILEDDLWLVPGWKSFAEQALQHYENDERIAAIALYHQHYHALSEFPFYPLADGSDVYFMQYPCSSGFVISPSQAKAFRLWLEKNKYSVPANASIPAKVNNWPNSSWKKLFAAYLADVGKFVVYPRSGFSTNFGDAGTHHKNSNRFFQTPLQFVPKSTYNLPTLDASPARYDSYMEWCGDTEVCFDLYGFKPLEHITKNSVLTSKKPSRYSASLGCHLKPAEMNYLHKIPGDDFFLCRKEDMSIEPLKKPADFWYGYYLPDNETLMDTLKRKLKR